MNLRTTYPREPFGAQTCGDRGKPSPFPFSVCAVYVYQKRNFALIFIKYS